VKPSLAAASPIALRRWMLALPLAGAAYWLLQPADHARDYGIAEVGLDEARALIAAGAVVVDARAGDAYRHRHLPDAINLPLATLRIGVPATFSAAKEQPVLVYCGDGTTIGPEATSLLNRAGYARAVNLKPGIEGWADARLPIAKG
jgi:rhodanese-related sulfurtransferase